MPEPQIAHQAPLVAPPNHLPVAGLHDAGASARGQSAELLAAEGAAEGGKTPPVEETPAVQPVSEDQLNLIANLYQMIIEHQVRAVTNVQASVKEKDPPSLASAVISSLGKAAIGGAVGALGSLVGALASTLARNRGAGTIMVQTVAGSMTNFVTAGLDKAIEQGQSMIEAETNDSIERFFRTQVNALVEVSDQQRIAFDETQRDVIRNAPAPFDEAQVLIEALKQVRTNAYACQRQHVVDAWVAAQAQKSAGITADAVALARGEQGPVSTFLGEETAEPGADFVLSIEVSLGSPGDAVVIEGAELPGANHGLRNLIADRPLGSVKVPFVVHGKPPAGIVKVGRNEAGLVWNRSDPAGNTWLGRRGKIEESKSNGEQPARSPMVPPVMETFFGTTLVLHPVYDKDATNGAQVLVEKDMKDLTIPSERIES